MAELPNIKPGDEVIARFKVAEVGNAGVTPGDAFTVVALEHITEVIPAPKAIKVGDRVKWTHTGGREWRVCGLDAEVAWVKTTSDIGSRGTAHLSNLTLIEDEGHG